MLGSKNRLKPIIAEGLSNAADHFPDSNRNVSSIFLQEHNRIKQVIADSRHKAKLEKKHDKKYITSIADFIVGVGLIVANIHFCPTLIAQSSVAGFTTICISIRKLDLEPA
jgi:hypothetical protein